MFKKAAKKLVSAMKISILMTIAEIKALLIINNFLYIIYL